MFDHKNILAVFCTLPFLCHMIVRDYLKTVKHERTKKSTFDNVIFSAIVFFLTTFLFVCFFADCLMTNLLSAEVTVAALKWQT